MSMSEQNSVCADKLHRISFFDNRARHCACKTGFSRAYTARKHKRFALCGGEFVNVLLHRLVKFVRQGTLLFILDFGKVAILKRKLCSTVDLALFFQIFYKQIPHARAKLCRRRNPCRCKEGKMVYFRNLLRKNRIF